MGFSATTANCPCGLCRTSSCGHWCLLVVEEKEGEEHNLLKMMELIKIFLGLKPTPIIMENAET
jgi:hypothetical protein